MASIAVTQGNCGIAELHGLADGYAYQTVYNAYQGASNKAHIWFSDADKNGYGERLRKEIVVNNLGTVISTPSAVNPQSKNAITGYFWTPDFNAVKSYLKAKGYSI